MRKFRFVGTRIVLFGVLGVGLLGLAILILWNALMPALFSLPPISFWQALGLFFLSRLLFGRFGGWGHRMRGARFVRGWKHLTPEERQRFRRAMGLCRPENAAESSPEP